MPACTLGSMGPGAKCPSSTHLFAFLTEIRLSHVSCGMPKWSATCSTAVRMMRKSAFNSRASRQPVKSLPITAPTPLKWFPLRIAGMPPPPLAMTISPASGMPFTVSGSTISAGLGRPLPGGTPVRSLHYRDFVVLGFQGFFLGHKMPDQFGWV